MSGRIKTTVLGTVLALAGTTLNAQTAAPSSQPTTRVGVRREMLTTAQMRQLIDDGKFPEASRAIGPILNVKTPVAGYDRIELYMLRAECELQMKQNGQAVSTLEYVAKEADAANSQEVAGRALAFATLIRRSPEGLYAPRLGDTHVPINVRDRSKRDEAYAKLYADEAARLDKQVVDARGATSLVPLLDIAKNFRAVKGLERVTSGGNTPTCDALAPKVTSEAGRMLDSMLDKYHAAIPRIDREASQIVTKQRVNMGNGRRNGGPKLETFRGRAGLTRANVAELQGIVADCNRTSQAIKAFNLAFASPQEFEGMITRAENIRVSAEGLLREDFSN